MKNTIFASVTAFLFAASTVSAADLSGTVGVEITENSAGNYVAATTLGFGVNTLTDSGVAFGGFTFESADGGTIAVDEWHVGYGAGQTAISIGSQGDVFVEGRMETVGGSTLNLPNDSVDSVIVTRGAATVFVGLTDVAADITDVSNVQIGYAGSISVLDLAGVVDYNQTTEETTIGLEVDYTTGLVDLGTVLVYAVDAETLGYEAYAGYQFATVFANGSDSDAVQNVGFGLTNRYDLLSVYAEAEYNIDAENTAFGIGAVLNF